MISQEEPLETALGIFGCLYEAWGTSAHPGLTSELPSQPPSGASLISGGAMAEWSRLILDLRFQGGESPRLLLTPLSNPF